MPLNRFAPAILAIASLSPAALCLEEASPRSGLDSAEGIRFFEKQIRPVLVEKCYKCHSEKAEKVRGGLLLDTRAGIRRGGDNGPAVVPGNLKESLLIQAVRYQDKDFAMPPEKSGGKLPEAVVQNFEKWIAMGAPDSREGAAPVVKKYDAGEARKLWSFQPVKKPAIPSVAGTTWPRNDVDRFILAGLERKGVAPTADADKFTLLRRVYFDLTGLPPSPEEIESYSHDASPNAYDKLVDRLLASPQYGERWGRHWLDVARYAESSGKDVNIAYPHAWRYRDYVIDAFNKDKPYDQFIREQIAGDLLPAKDSSERAEHDVATGFLSLGPKSLNEMNPRQFALDVADEQIDTMSQAMLGLTVSCARCHDHKFDPIPQRDYYALAGIFLSTETRYGTAAGIQNRHASELVELPVGAGVKLIAKTLPPAERARKEAQLEALRKEQKEFIAERFKARMQPLAAAGASPGETPKLAPGSGKGDPAKRGLRALIVLTQIGFLESELKSFDASGHSKALAMGVQDRPAEYSGARGFKPGADGFRSRYGGLPAFRTITDSPLYARGDADKPGEKVPRGFLTAFEVASTPPIQPLGSGRRELAEWLTNSQNPLVARVMANRVWHWLFGRGIVESVDNFGVMGQRPSNPELLDYLATRLVENGWSIKQLVKEILLSRAYRMASTFQEKDFALDPENVLVWRQSKRRLDAECIRDAMLAVGGQLDKSAPTGSVIAQTGDGPIGQRRYIGVSEDTLVKGDSPHRSVYLAIARDVLPDALAVFDFAEPSLVTGARETTNVPAQALFLLNSPFAAAQSQKFAERVLTGYPAGANGGVTANLDQRLTYAYWMAFARPPDAVERQAAFSFFSKFPASTEKSGKAPAGWHGAEQATVAWSSFCRALFATAEFRYLN